ncbi:uncharacterized protein EI90DRAFT_3091226 [Cantharellus anzutake]|uniref:uncharacterized protein n=1 Tax=Cantharellus anzutake TaxID=1750568 RepID=UPI001902DD33|nr:uncharacterized protein EI90DRAFT_3091226 [Cantharellus anzutake]KAF8313917.1 hypothetical protein EI90DRAFT_3091226 [Cantharellus anzutake]
MDGIEDCCNWRKTLGTGVLIPELLLNTFVAAGTICISQSMRRNQVHKRFSVWIRIVNGVHCLIESYLWFTV